MKAIRSDEEIQSIREACQVAATVLKQLVDTVSEGMTTYDLDQLGRKAIADLGAESACYNYRAGENIFPAFTCISVNEEIVHGIGSMRRVIQGGDVVSIDVVVRYRGFIGDNAKIGTGERTRDNHCAVEPDSVRATMACTETCVAINMAAMAMAWSIRWN